MYRKALKQLSVWKDREGRKPLIIRGARQVGKTWLMREFGRASYKNCVYINCDNNPRMTELFSTNLDTKRLLMGMELYSGERIVPGETLLIFDEVQEIPRALTSLKYFDEDAPQYHIVAAGSLLGIALHPGTSFPVGKVEFLDLYPLSFSEFMMALGNERFMEIIEAGDWSMVKSFAHIFTEALKLYYFTGGMPAAALHFCEHKDFNAVREIQANILAAYEQDFS
ncbi:MAG: AAA family ATPase, partial [Spirochaetales bacterium]|nr:AAA family ATPase [Spirochaetales bacterium]